MGKYSADHISVEDHGFLPLRSVAKFSRDFGSSVMVIIIKTSEMKILKSPLVQIWF